MHVLHPAGHGVEAVGQDGQALARDSRELGLGGGVVAGELVVFDQRRGQHRLVAARQALGLHQVDIVVLVVVAVDLQVHAVVAVPDLAHAGGGAPRVVVAVDAYRVALGNAFVGFEHHVTLVVEDPHHLDLAQGNAGAAGLGRLDVVGLDRAVEPEGGLAPGEVALQDAARLDGGAFAVEAPVVQHVAVGGHHRADVLGALHAALDLEAGDAGLDQIGYLVDQLQVVGAEEVAVVVVVGLEEAAAGLGAGAAVGRASAQVAGEQAQAGGRDAERAVHEGFQLDIGGSADALDFGQRQLARQDDALEVVARQEVGAVGRADVHLGGGVQVQAGEVLAGQLDDAQVLDDDAVGADFFQILQQLVHAVGLALLEHGVDGDVYLFAQLVQAFGGGFELAEGEIGRAQAGVEVLEAEVDGVGAFADGGVEGFRRAGGGQQFGSAKGHSDSLGVGYMSVYPLEAPVCNQAAREVVFGVVRVIRATRDAAGGISCRLDFRKRYHHPVGALW